jgi:hypothetical protein
MLRLEKVAAVEQYRARNSSTIPAGLVVIAVFVLTMVPAALLVGDTPALSYQGLPFPVSQAVYAPGDSVQAYTTRCNRFDRNMPYHYLRKLVSLDGDERQNHLLEGQNFAPGGCVATWVTLMRVPPEATAGWYRVEGLIVINGQWRTFEVGWATVAFEVRDAQ